MKNLAQKFIAFQLITAFVEAHSIQAQRQTRSMSPPALSVRSDDDKEWRFYARPFVRTELFFGRSKPDGAEISDAEFTDFLSETVMSEFPDG